jgi:putative spermidine/putrescine transport system permease protein
MAQLDRQLTPELYAIGTVTTVFSFAAIGIFTVAFWALRRRVQAR